MSFEDDDNEEQEELKELTDRDLFDATDVTWTYVPSKDNRRLTLIAKSATPISRLKLYLALRAEMIRFEYYYAIDEEHGMEH